MTLRTPLRQRARQLLDQHRRHAHSCDHGWRPGNPAPQRGSQLHHQTLTGGTVGIRDAGRPDGQVLGTDDVADNLGGLSCRERRVRYVIWPVFGHHDWPVLGVHQG